MTNKFTYRLQLLLEQREKAKKEAETEQARLEQELERQQATLCSFEQREQKLIDRRNHWRSQLLSVAGSVTSQEACERSEFVKAIGLDIQAVRNDILSQQQVIKECEGRVQQAQARLQEARREQEILSKHRAKQEERFLRELQAKEDLELDEIGNVLYTTRRHIT